MIKGKILAEARGMVLAAPALAQRRHIRQPRLLGRQASGGAAAEESLPDPPDIVERGIALHHRQALARSGRAAVGA